MRKPRELTIRFYVLYHSLDDSIIEEHTIIKEHILKRSSHLTRIIIEGISNFSAYKGARLLYQREFDPDPNINVDLTTKIDIERAIDVLYKRKDLSDQEVQMLRYVMLDGRLSRRDISAMIEREEGYYVDQRTVSRRLETAYFKISRFLGYEYSDARLFKMVAKKLGYPPPYILSDEEIDKYTQIMERV